jgi:hypothetical protein
MLTMNHDFKKFARGRNRPKHFSSYRSAHFPLGHSLTFSLLERSIPIEAQKIDLLWVRMKTTLQLLGVAYFGKSDHDDLVLLFYELSNEV